MVTRGLHRLAKNKSTGEQSHAGHALGDGALMVSAVTECGIERDFKRKLAVQRIKEKQSSDLKCTSDIVKCSEWLYGGRHFKMEKHN